MRNRAASGIVRPMKASPDSGTPEGDQRIEDSGPQSEAGEESLEPNAGVTYERIKLESLDLAYTENQELEVEGELLKEDNEQLVTQYEREKQLRKGAEARLMELEDAAEGDRKEAAVKVESLTSIVKMFELKAKNSVDQSE